jgi:hypothetical protein
MTKIAIRMTKIKVVNMKISNTFIKKDFPVSMYKGRVILQEDDESFSDIIGDAKRQIDADIEAEIRAVVEKVLRERESR